MLTGFKSSTLGTSWSNAQMARNTAVVLFAQTAPLIVTLATLPLYVRTIGTEKVGILSLVWMLVGYLSFLELGMGRSVTHVVSRTGASGRQEVIPEVYWSAVSVQALLGLAGALVVAISARWFMTTLLKVPQGLQSEAVSSLTLAGLILPLVLTSSTASGLLQAVGRFGRASLIAMFGAVAGQVGPLLVALHDRRLTSIVASLAAVRVTTAIALHVAVVRALPGCGRPRLRARRVRALLRFGSFVTVSSVLSPMLTYSDRFAIGAMVSMSAVAFYSVPYDALMKITIIPAAVVSVLFPFFSAHYERAVNTGVSATRISGTVKKAYSVVFFAVSLPLVFFVAYGDKVVALWMGSEFSVGSGIVPNILALGVLFTCIAYIPYTLIQGMGRPDLTAKIHVSELAVHMCLLYVASRYGGAIGVASVWTTRCLFDMGAMVYVAGRIGQEGHRLVGLTTTVVYLCFTVGMLFVPILLRLLGVNGRIGLVVGLGWIGLVWLLGAVVALGRSGRDSIRAAASGFLS